MRADVLHYHLQVPPIPPSLEELIYSMYIFPSCDKGAALQAPVQDNARASISRLTRDEVSDLLLRAHFQNLLELNILLEVILGTMWKELLPRVAQMSSSSNSRLSTQDEGKDVPRVDLNDSSPSHSYRTILFSPLSNETSRH
jgi:hypothetical protein